MIQVSDHLVFSTTHERLDDLLIMVMDQVAASPEETAKVQKCATAMYEVLQFHQNAVCLKAVVSMLGALLETLVQDFHNVGKKGQNN